MEYDLPVAGHCWSCSACIDACPTEALIKPYQIDGSKCISYLTVELNDSIPSEFQGEMDNWAFGCDVCQTVCPWNRFATPRDEPAFKPQSDLLSLSKKEWVEMTDSVYNAVFKNSAVKKTKFEGLKRNIKFLSLEGH